MAGILCDVPTCTHIACWTRVSGSDRDLPELLCTHHVLRVPYDRWRLTALYEPIAVQREYSAWSVVSAEGVPPKQLGRTN
jgi:hypothetical protein